MEYNERKECLQEKVLHPEQVQPGELPIGAKWPQRGVARKDEEQPHCQVMSLEEVVRSECVYQAKPELADVFLIKT